MKLNLIFLLVISNIASGMHRAPSPSSDDMDENNGELRIEVRNYSRDNMDSSDEDILVNAALEIFRKNSGSIPTVVERHVKKIIEDDKKSPFVDHKKLSMSFYRRDSASNSSLSEGTMYLHDVLMKASQQALEEQERTLQEINKKISQKLNRRSVAILVGSVSAIMTTIASLIVKYKD
jgi:hypothetical protein